MALISCPECEHRVSSYAVACPNCGFPLALIDQLKNDGTVDSIAVEAALLAADPHRAPVATTCTALAPGAFITLGNWGGEDIEWFALQCDGEKALILSEKGIDCLPYHELDTKVDWAGSSIRQWLNGEFLQGAFTPEERARILVSNEEGVTTEGHENVAATLAREKVFLLSVDQANRYFQTAEARVCSCTAYAKSRGVWLDVDGGCRWWLRTPSEHDHHACLVLSDGTVFTYGSFVDNDRYAVRPALWLAL